MHAPKQRKKLNQEENRTTTYICISSVNIFGEKEAIFFFYHSGTLMKVRNSFLHVWLFVLTKIEISFGI